MARKFGILCVGLEPAMFESKYEESLSYLRQLLPRDTELSLARCASVDGLVERVRKDRHVKVIVFANQEGRMRPLGKFARKLAEGLLCSKSNPTVVLGDSTNSSRTGQMFLNYDISVSYGSLAETVGALAKPKR